MPHRERDGADRGLPGLRTWGEVWMGRPEDPSFQHQSPPGLSYVREKNCVDPMSLCSLLGYNPCPLKKQQRGPELVRRAWGKRIRRSSVGGGWVKLPQAGRREAGGWAQFVLGVKGEFFSKEFWERRQLEQAANHPSLSLSQPWGGGGACQPDLTLSSLCCSEVQDGGVGERTLAGLNL